MAFGIMDTLFPVLFVLITITIITVFIMTIVSVIKKNSYNNSQPVLTVNAKVVSKRTKAVGEHTRTYYYVTFEFESRDRLEMKINGDEYGMLVEGDKGQLTFQGDRYLGFKRL